MAGGAGAAPEGWVSAQTAARPKPIDLRVGSRRGWGIFKQASAVEGRCWADEIQCRHRDWVNSRVVRFSLPSLRIARK
jgi:hypothetical protein